MDEPFFEKYLKRAQGAERPVDRLIEQSSRFLQWCRSVSPASTQTLHAPYTWTLCQVLNHLSDSERVFAFRALWFARDAREPMPSFDEHLFSARAAANDIDWHKLVDEFQAVRSATIALFANLPSDAWQRGGQAAGYQMNVSMLWGMIYGHVDHHFEIMQARLTHAK